MKDLVPSSRDAATEQQPGWTGRRIMTEYTIVGGPTVTAHLAVDKDGRVVGATISGTTDPREAEIAASEVARQRRDGVFFDRTGRPISFPDEWKPATPDDILAVMGDEGMISRTVAP